MADAYDYVVIGHLSNSLAMISVSDPTLPTIVAGPDVSCHLQHGR